jgi:ubiquinone/menaquinone biosynthesis C-methylase UbiE
MINSFSPGNVLDAGCAEGFALRHMRKHRDRSPAITGMDIDYKALLFSKAEGQGRHFIQADIQKIPFKDSSFDLVLCLEVLEHLVFIDTALAELKRVAKKSCIISIPLEPCFSVCRMLAGKDIARFGRVPEHISCFNAMEVKAKLKSHFKLEETIISFPWIIFRVSAK